jgi:hypothetical protein
MSRYINITKEYPWTLNYSAKENAPRVVLKEFQVNESSIKRQAAFYATGVKNFLSSTDSLQAYEGLYPKDLPTGFVYDMPYFSDINFEVNTPMWASLDTLEQIKSVASGIGGIIGGPAGSKLVNTVADLAGAGAMAGLATAYPKVGITDRPRLWNSHEPRSIQIKFPLFNTVNPDDWKSNRELCELLVNQNLYNKRDFITSIPPVFYEVLVLGQHYSYASCVTNLTIHNHGNMRLMRDSGGVYNVPDAYEVNLTLTDMVMPSKNMFQAINESKIFTDIATSAFADGTTIGQDIINNVPGAAAVQKAAIAGDKFLRKTFAPPSNKK